MLSIPLTETGYSRRLRSSFPRFILLSSDVQIANKSHLRRARHPFARGVQQRDPLGPLLFCLLTRNLSRSLQSPFNVWYLDDATLGGDFELVSRDFQTIVKIGASLGLELNTSKCEFVVCGGTPTQQQVTRQKMKLLCPGVIFPDKETLTLLGAPVFPEAIPPVLEKKIQQAELMTSRLESRPTKLCFC
ncbi:hypothetical protein RvY_11387-2 [Ramazzottius varieornatus]|uniref:Reverse transcriptase domain-containing protein n=1 Tax=Ramazzottius varieornatus TaxID=947166 RepID=A0A1D1VLE2_RAMVA|nr:hypothetical protein RvY_11387-2 [Ramazzottius varieornatus]